MAEEQSLAQQATVDSSLLHLDLDLKASLLGPSPPTTMFHTFLDIIVTLPPAITQRIDQPHHLMDI